MYRGNGVTIRDLCDSLVDRKERYVSYDNLRRDGNEKRDNVSKDKIDDDEREF